MKNDKSLKNIRQTLHDLLNSLPAIRANCSTEAVRRHLMMIAYYQRQYDLLLNPNSNPNPAPG